MENSVPYQHSRSNYRRESFSSDAALIRLEPASEPSVPTEFDFPLGLPAFEEHTRFRLNLSPPHAPLVFLESLLPPHPRFICLPVEEFFPGYAWQLDAEEDARLGPGPRLCLAILTFPESGAPTANLLAPVVLGLETRRGVQSIQTGGGWAADAPLPYGEEPQCS